MAWDQPKFVQCAINFEFKIQLVAIASKVLGQRRKPLGEMQCYGRTYNKL